MPPQGGRKHPQQDFLQVDTTNILFICAGAFGGLEKIISKRGASSSIGFSADLPVLDNKRNEELLLNLEPQDLLQYGLIPEFIGRLPIIATLKDLNKEALINILTKPKNALIKQYEKMFDMENVKLTFTDDALESIADRALIRETGARGLRSILENILVNTMFDLPNHNNVEEVVINKEVINENKDPLLVYSKSNQKVKSSIR